MKATWKPAALRWLPLPLLAGVVFLLPLTSPASGADGVRYRPPTALTPGHDPANVDRAVAYADAGFVSLPAPASVSAALDAPAAARAADAYWKNSAYASSAEVALRLIRFSDAAHAGYYGLAAGQDTLAYVVIAHNVPAAFFGGPHRDTPVKGPEPRTVCIDVMLVDPGSGAVLGGRREQLC